MCENVIAHTHTHTQVTCVCVCVEQLFETDNIMQRSPPRAIYYAKTSRLNVYARQIDLPGDLVTIVRTRTIGFHVFRRMRDRWSNRREKFRGKGVSSVFVRGERNAVVRNTKIPRTLKVLKFETDRMTFLIRFVDFYESETKIHDRDTKIGVNQSIMSDMCSVGGTAVFTVDSVIVSSVSFFGALSLIKTDGVLKGRTVTPTSFFFKNY